MMLQRHSRRRADRRGFTLMEVLVVVAIVLVLASVATISVFSYLDNAKRDAALANLKALTNACKTYKLRFDEYPPSLEQLLTLPNGGKSLLDNGREALTDPWGQPYRYDQSGQQNRSAGRDAPDISCMDPDGKVIGNWMTRQEAR